MSDLREAIAAAITEALDGKPWDNLGAADAALAAIEAQGVRLVWMKPAVLPGPQMLSETTITMTEPATVEVRLGGTGGGEGD
jgi:hypothetical protein